MKISANHSKNEKERGLYLILVAFFIFVLVALCGLVIGLGFLSTNRSRLQNIANVSSIAALDGFIQARNPSTGDPLAYDVRKTVAMNRANELIVANKKLPGVRFDLGEVGLAPAGGNGGKLTVGMWYPEIPATGTPCGANASDYPCFRENPVVPTGTPIANAVRLEVFSQPTNPLIAPFASFFGQHGITLNTTSIARVVQRCVVFLLDVSLSTVQETHLYGRNAPAPLPPDPACIPPELGGACTPLMQVTLAPTPALVISEPQPPSLFAYRVSALGPLASRTPPLTPPPFPTPNPCQNLTSYWAANSGEDLLYFCNMKTTRTGFMSPPYVQHYRSDYRIHPSIFGDVFIDKYEENINTYVGPEPLSRFFLSFNAGLRAVNQVRSPGDKALLYVFTGKAVGTEPQSTPPTYELTENLNSLIQLTNIYNRGTIDRNGAIVHPVVTPNFVSRGFFPILATSADTISTTTNLGLALWDAIGALSSCPDSARRSIIVATDGIPSCGWNTQGSLNGTPRPDPIFDCPPPTNGDYYSNYLQAEQSILGPIKDELVRRGISVTALLDAENIQPNFINATIPPGAGTPTGDFVDPEDAAQNGFCAGVPTPIGGGAAPCDKPFFLSSPVIPDAALGPYNAWVAGGPSAPVDYDHFAFKYSDTPNLGVKFRRPNALWGQLALDTQGVICPLLPECPPQAYAPGIPPNPPQILPTWRQGMSVMDCSPAKQSKAQQAVNCVLAAIGVNPYQNVEEIPPTVAP